MQAVVKVVLLLTVAVSLLIAVTFLSGGRETVTLSEWARLVKREEEMKVEVQELRELILHLSVTKPQTVEGELQTPKPRRDDGIADTVKVLSSSLKNLEKDVHALKSTAPENDDGIADKSSQPIAVREDAKGVGGGGGVSNEVLLSEIAKVDDRLNWLSSMVVHSRGFLDKHADSIDEWLSASEREYRTFTPLRDGYPDIRNISHCEAIIDDVLQLDTGFDAAHHGQAAPAWVQDFAKNDWQQAEPHTMTAGVCDFYRRLQQVKTCRPAGSRSFIFHAMNIIVPDRIQSWLQQLRRKISQFEVDGVVYYTFLHMQSENQQHRWKGSTLLEWAITNAKSFKRAFGKYPLIIANDKKSYDALTAAGIPSILDETPFWRGSYANGEFRRLSRTVLTKYVYAYFIIEIGLTAVFFDTDSFWLRKPILPPPGQYDVLGMVESPGIHATRHEKVFPDHHNFQRLNFGYRLREYSWCGKHVDYIPITSGVWAVYPTEWALRLLANYLDFALVAGDFWWEQNLWSYLLIQYTGWGLRWGNFHPDSFTGANRGEMKNENDCRSRVQTAWVHTKFVKESYTVCSQYDFWTPPENHTDIIPGSITLHLLDNA